MECWCVFKLFLESMEMGEEIMNDRDKNDIKLDSGVIFADWNKYSMDELADYLEQKWKFMSSGEALAIMKMVDFYKENKNKCDMDKY